MVFYLIQWFKRFVLKILIYNLTFFLNYRDIVTIKLRCKNLIKDITDF